MEIYVVFFTFQELRDHQELPGSIESESTLVFPATILDFIDNGRMHR